MLRTTTTKFAKKNRETILPYVQARLLNDITAVLLFAIASVLAIMLFTYSPSDRCWFRIADNYNIHNKFGWIGSYTSDIIFSIFGHSGWWLVVGIFYLGYRKITRSSIGAGSWYSILQIITFILLMIASSTFEFLAFYGEPAIFLHNGYGGMFGHFIFSLFFPILGAYNIEIITLIAVVICSIITFSSLLLQIAERVGELLEIIYLQIVQLFKPKDEVPQVIAKPIVADKMAEEHDFGELSNLLSEQIETKPDASEDYENEPIVAFTKSRKRINVFKSEAKVDPEDTELDLELPPILAVKPKLGASGLPSTNLLSNPINKIEVISDETIEYISLSIENKLSEFGVEAKVVNAESGPVITRYELLPSRGVRGDKIVGLGKEIARGLALTNVRIVETIPGKNSMGIEVPNFKRQIIYLKEIFDSPVYKQSKSKLTLALGKDISGNVIVTDLAKMPHLLVAGTTGSGKSVAINAMILSILFQATPDEVKFIMIDPKMVELSFYQDIPHLLSPVVTDMNQAANALKWTVAEMERRYKIMAKVGCKNIISFNQKVQDAVNKNEPIRNPLTLDLSIDDNLAPWPYIVVIIDELADLMMVTGKKIEQYIARIAQKARAVGIHLIVATQRPSVDVITGLIKANIPARISFQVSSKIDSRTILDQMGAETLLGQGDMLFLQPGSGFPQRIHGAYVNDDELNHVVEFLKATGSPTYVEDVLEGDVDGVELPGFEDEGNDPERDTIFDDAVKFIYESKRCSISALQTRFGIGYNRAARIMSHLETIGMVRRNEKGGFELLKTNVI